MKMTKNDKSKKKIEKKETPGVVRGLKKFFNSPVPLIVVLLFINAFLVIYISQYNAKNRIFVGYVDEEEVQVANIHYFSNGAMNYFYASNALYLADDQDIYSYQIGYYVVDSKNNYIELATRSNSLENSTSLKDVVDEMSGWSFAEADKSEYFFTSEVLKYMDNLHFVIKASTEEGSTSADVYYDFKVDTTKVTK